MSDIPKWEDTEEIDSSVPKFEDTTPTWEETEEVKSQAPALDKMGIPTGEGGDPTVKGMSPNLASAGMGAAQGATFGFADEIGGAIAAAPSLVTPGKSVSDSYTKYRDLIRAKDTELKEASPFSYGGGEVLGGLAQAVGTGGMGALTKLAGTGAAKLGLKGAAGRIATATGSGALQGATGGALYGAGQAETLEQIPEFAVEGGASGALIGGGLGLAGSSIVEGTKAAADAATKKLMQYRNPRQIARAYEEGTKGVSLGTTEDELLAQAQRKTGDTMDTAGRIIAEEKRLGQEIGDMLNRADDAGVRVKLDDALDSSAKQVTQMLQNDPNIINNPKYAKLIKNIFDLEQGSLSPVLAQETVQEMYDLSRKLNNPLLSDVAEDFAKNLSLALDSSVEGLRDAKNAFKNYRAALPETLINKGAPTSIIDPMDMEKSFRISGKQYGTVKDKEAKLISTVENLLEEVSQSGSSKATADQTMNALKDNLLQLEKSSPGTVKRLGFDSVDDFLQDIRSKGDIETIRQDISQSGIAKSFKDSGLFGGTASILSGKAAQVANLAGKKIAPIAKTSKAIFDAPDQIVRGLADKLMQDPKLAPLGNLLIKAMDNKAGIGKNAALFSIMQNPEARKVIDMNFNTPEDDLAQ